MATRSWAGKTAAVSQTFVLTPTVAATATYSVSIPDANGKTVSYVSDASPTAAEITAGLVAALTGAADIEFAEIQWLDQGGTIKATGPPGVPLAYAVTANLAVSGAVAATGP